MKRRMFYNRWSPRRIAARMGLVGWVAVIATMTPAVAWAAMPVIDGTAVANLVKQANVLRDQLAEMRKAAQAAQNTVSQVQDLRNQIGGAVSLAQQAVNDPKRFGTNVAMCLWDLSLPGLPQGYEVPPDLCGMVTYVEQTLSFTSSSSSGDRARVAKNREQTAEQAAMRSVTIGMQQTEDVKVTQQQVQALAGSVSSTGDSVVGALVAGNRIQLAVLQELVSIRLLLAQQTAQAGASQLADSPVLYTSSPTVAR